MATAEEIKALIRSHAEGDEERFYTVASSIAMNDQAKGREKSSTELLKLIERCKNKPKKTATGTILIPGQPNLSRIFETRDPAKLSDLELSKEVQDALVQLCKEHQQSARLLLHGLSPSRKLLLSGPPGTGKTMTAAALAGELGMPLFLIRLDGLIRSHLGETAACLRQVFDCISSNRGVYLFDEIDAIARARGGAGDRDSDTEMVRVLNSFLQMIEQDVSGNLIVGTTNHIELLDRALFRRFDVVLRYENPTPDAIVSLMMRRLQDLGTSQVDWTHASQKALSLSHAEILTACDAAAKHAILSVGADVESSPAISQQELLRQIQLRKDVRRA